MHVMRAVRPTTNAPSSSAGTSDAECSADAARAELDRQALTTTLALNHNHNHNPRTNQHNPGPDRQACVAEQRADTWAFGCLLTRLALHQLHQKVS